MPEPGRRTPEQWTRFISYLVGAAWAVIFTIFVPSIYAGVIDYGLIHFWLGLALLGCAASAVGAITGLDVKIELAGLYILQVSGLLYLVAQFGFFSLHPQQNLVFGDRFAPATYILWHCALFWPRIVRLELIRRAAHRRAKAVEP